MNESALRRRAESGTRRSRGDKPNSAQEFADVRDAQKQKDAVRDNLHVHKILKSIRAARLLPG